MPLVFISHLHTRRQLAHNIRTGLEKYGIAAFVAHDDIEPMAEWQNEIQQALRDMDLLVALLSPGFENSAWTDQEVGAAVGRNIPVVPVRLGRDPYGFIGRYQGLTVDPDAENAGEQIADFAFSELLRTNSGAVIYIELLSASESYAMSNDLANYLPRLTELLPDQEEALVEAFNRNSQVSQAWHIKDQIIQVLNDCTGHRYEFIPDRTYNQLRIRE